MLKYTMGKILGIIGIIFVIGIVICLLPMVVEFLWELFWVIAAIFIIIAVVRKFG